MTTTTIKNTLSTVLGKVVAHPSDATTVFVTLGVRGDAAWTIQVNGNGWTGSMALKLSPEGNWILPDGLASVTLDPRWNGTRWLEASDSARQKVATVVTAAVQEFYYQNPVILSHAQAALLAENIKRTEAEVTAIRENLSKALLKIHRWENELNTLTAGIKEYEAIHAAATA